MRVLTEPVFRQVSPLARPAVATLHLSHLRYATVRLRLRTVSSLRYELRAWTTRYARGSLDSGHNLRDTAYVGTALPAWDKEKYQLSSDRQRSDPSRSLTSSILVAKDGKQGSAGETRATGNLQLVL